MGRCLGEESVKLALATPATTITNTAKITPIVPRTSSADTDTNSFLLSFKPQPASPSLPVSTVEYLADNAHALALVNVVIKKTSATTGMVSGQPGNGNFGFANFEAGYGQAYDCDSVLLRGRNGTAWEETRYVFFKKVVKF